MKRLIVIALLSSMMIGCGTSVKDQQVTTNQEYKYSDVQLDSSEISNSNNSESYNTGLELIYNTIGKPISEFNGTVDMSKFYSKRISDSNPMASPFDDHGIQISFNDNNYYFGIRSDKASWEDPSNFTLDYIYEDTYRIKDYLGLDIVINTNGSNMDEVKEYFAELWGSPLGTIEFRWEDDYADVYKYNDIYILALHSGDTPDNRYTDLVFSNEDYVRWVAAESQLSKIGLDKLSYNPSYINASDLESVTFQYMDAVFSVDISKIEFNSELLVTSDGTIVADKYTSCRTVSDNGNSFRFELSSIDDYTMELLEYNSKEYDNYKYYTSESEYDAYIETDNLTICVSNDLTEKERAELVEIINKEFILQ